MGKIGRLTALLLAAFGIGIVAASVLPPLAQSVRMLAGLAAPNGAEPSQQPREASVKDNGPVVLKLAADQIAGAAIDVAAVRDGVLIRRITVPGSVIPSADRIARVSVKLSGTVAELRKKLGDVVRQGEVLAILESREVADAKSEYLATRLTNELQQDLFIRDKALWEKGVSNEQQYLRSRNASAQTRMRFDIARQKLLALGLNEGEIAKLPDEPEASLRRQEVRSPIAGRVVERKVDLGTAVGRDNLETELFVVVDLDVVWIELAVSPADLLMVREGQSVTITARGVTASANGRIVFISPMLEKDTRSARVVAEIANGDGTWRPGSFVTTAIAIEAQPVPLAVPLGAVQTVGEEQVVFVRVPDGFEKRAVVLGRRDAQQVEIASGLRAGEEIAVSNTFVLKAEALKGLAED